MVNHFIPVLCEPRTLTFDFERERGKFIKRRKCIFFLSLSLPLDVEPRVRLKFRSSGERFLTKNG